MANDKQDKLRKVEDVLVKHRRDYGDPAAEVQKIFDENVGWQDRHLKLETELARVRGLLQRAEEIAEQHQCDDICKIEGCGWKIADDISTLIPNKRRIEAEPGKFIEAEDRHPVLIKFCEDVLESVKAARAAGKSENVVSVIMETYIANQLPMTDAEYKCGYEIAKERGLLADPPTLPQSSSLAPSGAESADIGKLDAADEDENVLCAFCPTRSPDGTMKACIDAGKCLYPDKPVGHFALADAKSGVEMGKVNRVEGKA